MEPWQALKARARRCERGFTLIELLIAMSLSLIVAGATMTFMIVSFDQGNAVSSRSIASRQAEAGLEQLVRDIRDAMSQNTSGAALSATVSNPTASSTSIAVDVPTPGADTTPLAVTWTCPSTAATTVGFCTRNGRREISGVLSMAFAPTSSSGSSLSLPASNPAYIGIILKVQVSSARDATQTQVVRGISNPITIQTGADLRNFQ